jgi:hypothetical protein
MMRFDQFQPLVHQGRRTIVTFAPIDQLMLEACSTAA